MATIHSSGKGIRLALTAAISSTATSLPRLRDGGSGIFGEASATCTGPAASLLAETSRFSSKAASCFFAAGKRLANIVTCGSTIV